MIFHGSGAFRAQLVFFFRVPHIISVAWRQRLVSSKDFFISTSGMWAGMTVDSLVISLSMWLLPVATLSLQHVGLKVLRYLISCLDSPRVSIAREPGKSCKLSYDPASLMFSTGHSIHRSAQTQTSGGIDSTVQWENGLCIQKGVDGILLETSSCTWPISEQSEL